MNAGWEGDSLLEDIREETEWVLTAVSDLSDDGLDTPTPAEPWSIRDQLAHLAAFDERAATAMADPDRFLAELERDFADGGEALMEGHFAHGRSLDADRVRSWFTDERERLLSIAASLDPGERRPWYGPPMTIRSSIVARLMETWAHGIDITDALGMGTAPTRRLFHVAELGVRTFRWSYQNRGMEVPDERVRVTLVTPQGEEMTWNPDRDQSVVGPVEDFCLVVAQRRHIDDTSLVVTGDVATEWMHLAQIFAGPPGPGRAPTRTQG